MSTFAIHQKCDLILENRPCAHLSGFLRNTDLKYSKYYSLLMLGNSHVRFVSEIMNATYKGWGGWKGRGWVG